MPSTKRPALPADIAGLRQRLVKARARGLPPDQEARGRRILDAWLAALERRGQKTRDILADLVSGAVAQRLAALTGEELRRENPPILANAACASGCAFCCILTEGDGGLITASEARQLHRALAPLAGHPDGRQWHPGACAALDPETRNCRAYDDRPTVCRSFLSVDVDACRENAAGGEAAGAGLLGNHLDYLAILALSRDLLKGTSLVATYSLEKLASAAVEGLPEEAALAAARHKTAELEKTCRDIGRSQAG
ncbi:YkgJ family cysteine cluster protein [Pseudooceanicola sp. C21-150M6]|uniref:YkgJ family cysteine cluster protein n=1 Tax=Pseudooceanicola sp. C21-150M6 TaxID=3434355 RepID=UPI003D7FD01F